MRLFPSKKHYTLIDKENIRAKHAAGMQQFVRLLAIVLLILILPIVSIWSIYPRTKREAELRKLEQAQEEYRKAKQAELQAQNHLRWMEDPEYFEQIVRDKANLAQPDEKVIRTAPHEDEKVRGVERPHGVLP